GDGTVKLWNLQGEELQTFKGHANEVNDVIFSPDGQTLASTSADGTVKLWNLQGEELQTLEGHTNLVYGVSFSPDGQTLASTSADGTVKLWNLQGEELQTLEGHANLVFAVSFSPDGQTLASTSADRTIILWNFNLDDLIAKSCNWLRDYMANPTTPQAERDLCANELRQSQTAPPSGHINWVAAVRSFGSRLLGSR
ncbi:MAG: WD40 repeat domain-containing protein, partial [Cyanobacteria bacterium P01_D01_bin.2]